MKINKKINTTLITDNDKLLLEEFQDEHIIKDISEIRNLKDTFVIFFHAFRSLRLKEKERLIEILESKNINFLNVTSDSDDALLAHKLIIMKDGAIALEGATLSVFKEEKILKHLGIKIPFSIELSLLLNQYDVIDSLFLDEEMLVKKLCSMK